MTSNAALKIEAIENSLTAKPAKAKPMKAKPMKAKPMKAKPAKSLAEMKEEFETLSPAKAILFKQSDITELSSADADVAISEIRGKGRALRRQAHKTACGILLHYVSHGDYTKLNLLLDAVGEAFSRRMRQGLADWVVTFSSLTYDNNTRRFNHKKGTERVFNLMGDKSQEEGTLLHSGALNNPFFSTDFGDKEEKGYDFEKAFTQFLKTMEREYKRREEASGKAKEKFNVTQDHINAMKKLGDQFSITLH